MRLESRCALIIREFGFNKLCNIRAEKACLIEDIFRVTKASCCMDSVHPRNLASPVSYFDRLYELSLDELELILAQMCAKLSRYMRDNVRLVNRGLSADDYNDAFGYYRGCDSE